MTTLLNNLPALQGSFSVSLSDPLGTPGDELSTITIDAETMTVISGIGSVNFTVDRGEEAIAHTVGATVTYAAGQSSDTLPTADEKAAMDAANSPSGDNAFATIADLPAIPLPRIAAGVPTGAPTTGENGMAIDTTAVSGGTYGWSGAAWVKGSSI